jgi:hypothetical protein
MHLIVVDSARHRSDLRPRRIAIATLVLSGLWGCTAVLDSPSGVGGGVGSSPDAGGLSTGGRAAGGDGTGGRGDGGGASGTAGARGTGGVTGQGGGGAVDAGAPGAGVGGHLTGGTGGAPAAGPEIFSACRFHFGTIDSKAKAGGADLIAQLDYFTPGWMLGASFDHKGVCDDTNPGGALANKVPVIVAYVAAGNVKRDHALCDCNVAGCAAGNLCTLGAQYITQDWTKIINAYRSYSQGFAACYGTTRPIVFEMEPDWYQYTGSSQTQRWTPAQAGQYMSQLVAALKTNLPNARFSLDVSPWVGPSNGGDNGAQWYANFDMSLFSFVNTSGGGTNANTAKIRPNNNMTWAGLHQVTGKPILADTGYGANGISAGPDPAWDVAANVAARIADGVVSIAQYNPSAGWAGTISSIRAQLPAPPACP